MFGPSIGSFRIGPFRELQRLQRDINRAFSGLDSYLSVQEYPALNIWGSTDNVIVTAELPGVDPDIINIAVVNDNLTLSGSRDPEVLKEGEVNHRNERNFGKFSRSVNLPFAVDAEKVTATYEKGILTIILPRAEKEKPRKISIKAS
ncbi:MAG: 18 kDa heat shock protein [Syntrophus sp. SKADARSKE-3]|nr:18 kDa heat shock protein [Syntrophus sp. SKADARSKE-3]